MLADIKEKILDTLKENNFNTDYTFEQIASGQMLVLDRPAASIDSRSGSGERETITQTNMKAMITITLVYHNVCQGISVDLAISKLRDSLIRLLNHNKLGFDFLKNGLLFKNFNNVTSRGGARDLQLSGFHVDEITLLCEYPIDEIPQPADVERGDLKSIVTKYFINNDSTPELEGYIDYTKIDGGTAYRQSGDTIDGGSTVEDQEALIYYGGVA